MVKFSILPFLLLLAIALPLLAAVSGARPPATEVDCIQRADLIGGDVDDGSIPIDNVELESDTDEQLADQGSFFEDEAGYILMPTDGNGDSDDTESSESSLTDLYFDSEEEDTESSESSTDLDFDSDEEDEENYDTESFDDSDFECEDTEDSIEEGKLGIAVGSVVTQAFFNSIISKAAPSCKGKQFYTRAAFLNAARSYPQFGQLKPDAAAKREIAAFFAHVTHETGSLCYIEEINKSTYCDKTKKQWPCARGKQYYGRGPLQLTWNYNYGPCGRANRFDGLKNPDIVARDRVVAWKAALWFWMKNVRPVLKNGFGATIRAINGALECNGKNPAAVRARVNFYKDYCRRFAVSPGSKLTC